MRQKIIPIMVSTYETLCKCIEEDVQIIHIWNNLYVLHTEEIQQLLTEYGYKLPDIPAKSGVFCMKEPVVDKSMIWDPDDLL